MAIKAVKYGVIGGILTVLVYTVMYAVNKEWLLSAGLHWSSLLIYLAAMIYTADLALKAGLTDFKGILKPVFICFLVANLIYYLYYYILTVGIDPGLAEMQVQQMLDKMEELQGGPIDPEKMKQRGLLSSYVFSYFQGALGGFILSAIIALAKKQ